MNAARLDPPHREPGIDLARGLAILGMSAAHLLATGTLVWSEPVTWLALVDGRSSILFATLAGLSLTLWWAGRERIPAGTPSPCPLLAARAAVLWLLGMVLTVTGVPVHVILPSYAILFALAIALRRRRTGTLVVLAAVIAALAPFVVAGIDAAAPDGPVTWVIAVLIGWHYPFALWTAFLAAGVAAGRLLAAGTVRAGAVLAGVGTVLAVAGYALIGRIGDRAADALDAGDARVDTRLLSVLQDAPHSSGVGEAIGSGGFALAVIGACLLLCGTPARLLAWPLRVLGSMPLTAYTAHVLAVAVWTTVARVAQGRPFDLYGPVDMPPFWPVTLGVWALCAAWALFAGRGPLETAVARASSWLAAPSLWRGRSPDRQTRRAAR